MHNTSRSILLAAITKLMLSAPQTPGADFKPKLPLSAPQTPGADFKPKLPRIRPPKYYGPHQGARECARRRGGEDWAKFRAADRVRRGLPVSWAYAGVEG